MNDSYDYDQLRAAAHIVEQEVSAVARRLADHLGMTAEVTLSEFDRAALLLAQYTEATLNHADEVDGVKR